MAPEVADIGDPDAALPDPVRSPFLSTQGQVPQKLVHLNHCHVFGIGRFFKQLRRSLQDG
jgi:hypothetical protein